MFLATLLFASTIGFLLVLLFSVLFREQTPWDNFWLFFLIVVLATWAGGLWIVPFGPTIFSIALLPCLFVGVFITILLASNTPRNPSKPQRVTIEEVQRNEPTDSTLEGLTPFFWIAMFLTLSAIIAAYLFLPIS